MRERSAGSQRENVDGANYQQPLQRDPDHRTRVSVTATKSHLWAQRPVQTSPRSQLRPPTITHAAAEAAQQPVQASAGEQLHTQPSSRIAPTIIATFSLSDALQTTAAVKYRVEGDQRPLNSS